MTELYHELQQAYTRSGLASGGPLVFGEGKKNPDILLIGEAPGEQEVLQGKPFVGKAGKNLSQFLETVGLCREDVYITNVVKFRPTKRSQAGRTVNRPPTRQEIAFFTPYLMREVRLLRPRLIVTLGNVALGAFLSCTIGEAHGELRQAMAEEEVFPIFPLYHPASVIYNPSLKQIYHEDLLSLRKIMEIC